VTFDMERMYLPSLVRVDDMSALDPLNLSDLTCHTDVFIDL
jgi:hypothetical protein